ncbi:amidohydrolase family protein [Vibrio kyushuensis]|uniref:N-acetylglucosamine-6-phosphate deacetylase n=1 Tax=Vibrio kyushuensis TaxID=2910249 RepID=UPI003D115838
MIFEAKTLGDSAVRVVVEGSTISEVSAIDTTDLSSLPTIAPGLIDLQVNGYGGVDFNSLPLHQADLSHATELMHKNGVTGYYPTIITNSDENISELIVEINRLKNSDVNLSNTLMGYHLEGPFISPKDGPRGAHSKQFVRAPEAALVKKWHELSEGQLKILTLSPEWQEGLEETVAYCVKNNIKVSIGHSAATPEQIQRVTQLGATMSTHLGNGCDLQIHRHHNYIWQQLAEDNLWSAIIADGFHLPPAVLKVILRAKQDKVILTSDTTAFGGMAAGRYQTHIGGEVVLTEAGKLHLASNDELLAGSAQSVLECVNYLIQSDLLSAEEAWSKASYSPASFMGLHYQGAIKAGNRADLVLLDTNNNQLTVMNTILAGDSVYSI